MAKASITAEVRQSDDARRRRSRAKIALSGLVIAILALAIPAGAQAALQFSAHADSPFSVGASPRQIASGDLNSDGLPDLVTANESSLGDLSIILSDGDGGFLPATSHPVYGSGATVVLLTDLAIADFNHDGLNDVVTTSRGRHEACLLLSNGDGTLKPRTCFGVGGSPYSLDISDLNRDGNTDLVTADRDSNSVSILLGDGQGGFDTVESADTAAAPLGVATGDFNGDGKPDLATASSTGSKISVLFGNGAGGFTPPIDHSVAPGLISGLTVSDVTGDGNNDIAFVKEYSSQWGVIAGHGNGDFDEPAIYDLGISKSLSDAKIADINQDGKKDIVLGAQGSASTLIQLADGHGGFTQPTPAFGNGSMALAVDDFNLDGKPDIAASRSPSAAVVDLWTNRSLPKLSAGSVAGGLGFGSVTVGSQSSTQQVVFTSDGDAAAMIAAVRIAGAAAQDFQITAEHCSGKTLLVGQQCAVSVAFKPNAGGPLAAQLEVVDDGSGTTVSVPLSGIATIAQGGPVADPPKGTAKVNLSRAIRPRKRQKVNAKGRAVIAIVHCPKVAGRCHLATPLRRTVKINGRRFKAKIILQKRLTGGKRAVARLVLPKPATKQLKGRQATVRTKIKVTTAYAAIRRQIRVKITAPDRPRRARR